MKYMRFFIFAISVFVFEACDKDKAEPTIPSNPSTTATANCADFNDFPDIPGWEHTEITVPNSFNREWKPYFIDAEKGFLFGSDQNILRTTDGGQNWVSTSYPVNSFYSMHFSDDMNGFLSAMDEDNSPSNGPIKGVLFKTADGGATWQKLNYTPDGIIWNMHFFDTQRGFASILQTSVVNSAIQSNSLLAKTEDGGATWEKIEGIAPSNSANNTLHFFPDGFGYFGGDDGVVYTTTDFGETWNSVETGIGFISVQFIDSMNGFVYASKQLRKTTDGGVTWTTISDKNTSFFHFFNETEGISLQTVDIYDHGDYRDECNAFFVTNDGGITWQEGQASFNFQLGEVLSLNDNLIYSSIDFSPGKFVIIKK